MDNQHWNNRIVGEGAEAPDQLLANPFNARIHPQYQQDALAGVLDSVGWVDRIIVNRTTGHVVDGHLRVMLALKRDEPLVPVQYVELTEDEEKLVLSTFDPITGLAAYDREKLDELLREVNSDSPAIQQMLAELAADNNLYLNGDEPAIDPGAQLDKAAILQEKWQVKRGDLFAIGNHRLLCGDSTNADDVARVMAGERADMAFADPPYNVTENEWDRFDESAFLAFLADVAKRLKEAIANHASLYVCLNWRYVANLKLLFDEYFTIKNWIIWFHSSRGADFKFYTPSHQDILFYVNSDQYYFNPSEILEKYSPLSIERDQYNSKQYVLGRDGKAPTDVWQFPTVRGNSHENEPHPTQKPIELVAKAVRASSKSADIILDPFLGSGTTLVACEQLGRQGRGIEISEPYCAVILERMSGMGIEPIRK